LPEPEPEQRASGEGNTTARSHRRVHEACARLVVLCGRTSCMREPVNTCAGR